jgi:TBC1 domain family member 2
VPFSLATRLWDTYLAEGSRLKGFLIYVAAAFLLSWSGPLRTMDFQVYINIAVFQPCSANVMS